MSERCPSCRRTIAATDARCPRCGANVSGVEIEGLTPGFGGDEVVVDGSGGSARPRRRTLVVLGAAAVLALVVAVTRGSGPASTAGDTTTATTQRADESTTSIVAPTTSSSAEPATTSTTIVRHEVTVDGGITVLTIAAVTNVRRALHEPSGLTVATADGGSAYFDDLDTGLRTSVLVTSSEAGIGQSNMLPFPGGVVISLSSPPGSGPAPAQSHELSVLVYANGAVRAPAAIGTPLFGGPGFGAHVAGQQWFTDQHDPHRVHLVELASGAVVRTVDLPPVATPIDGSGQALTLADPTGQLYDLTDDGTIVKRSATGTSPAPVGRHTEEHCDDALTSCAVDWVDGDGTRTALIDAEHSFTTAAAIAPAGPRLAALLPIVPCGRRGCSSGDAGTGVPLVVRDLDRQTDYRIGTTTAIVFGLGFGNGVSSSSLLWSSDGRWLFFPQITADGRSVTSAWRPGLFAPVEMADGAVASLLGAGNGRSVVFPTDTPMPAPNG